MLNKELHQRLIFLFVIAIIVWGAVLASYQGSSPQTEQHTAGIDTQGSAENDSGAQGNDVRPMLTFGEFLLGLFTFLLAIVGYLQYLQLGRTNESAEAVERAFLYPSGFTQFHEPDLATGQFNWRFRPIWQNNGNTPTVRLRFHTRCEVLAAPLPPGFRFDYNTPDIGVGMIGPKANAMGSLAPIPPRPPITAADILAAQAGAVRIYLWGWAEYWDVFSREDRPHRTRFCWVITPTGNPLTFVPNTPGTPPTPGTIAFGYVHHGEGNCADDECPH